jgi:hypothetical protein
MLQRFDMSIDADAKTFSIDEYAVLERRYRKRNDIVPVKDNYYLVYKATFDSDKIRAAIKKGKPALISALRSEGFFPVSDCAEQLAAKVTDMFGTADERFTQLFYDDRTAILPEEVEAEGDS